MHRIFHIQEMVDLVVQKLSVTSRPTEILPYAVREVPTYYDHLHHLGMDVRRDVRNLGRVGRIFREPCLNALWYHQGGIGELFRMISAVKGYRYNDEPCQKWVRRVAHSVYNACSSDLCVLRISNALYKQKTSRPCCSIRAGFVKCAFMKTTFFQQSSHHSTYLCSWAKYCFLDCGCCHGIILSRHAIGIWILSSTLWETRSRTC